MDVACGAFPEASLPCRLKVVEILGGDLREPYLAYAGDQVPVHQRRVLLMRGTHTAQEP
jgi:hypothetical protein